MRKSRTRLDVLAAHFAGCYFHTWERLTEGTREFWRDEARPVLHDIDALDHLRNLQGFSPHVNALEVDRTPDQFDCPQCGRDITPEDRAADATFEHAPQTGRSLGQITTAWVSAEQIASSLRNELADALLRGTK